MFNQKIFYCPSCFTQNADQSVFCGKCGVQLPTSQQAYINDLNKILQSTIKMRFDLANEAVTIASQIQLSKFELENIRAEKESWQSEKEQIQEDLASFGPLFQEQYERLDQLQNETAVHELGYYSPRYNFESSDVFRLRLESVRELQKELIKAKEAAKSLSEWSVNGSRAAGRKQTNDTLKLMLFAFNGESDVTISKVKFNNVLDAEKRIQKTFDLVNKLGSVQQCYITQDFLNLKLQELYLAHEYQEKLYEEKEEQRRIREQIREEEITRREIEKALNDAEREQKRYEEALERARSEVEKSEGEKQAKLLREIEILQQRLDESQANKERAISRAQMTRSGHVYIISNVGSFGENVYKIGMTRRLDPMDRVIELGDASVPFRFDVHAIIYCEDAPTLETKLHKIFHHRRVNAVNERKEFFRVSLEEISEAVHQNYGEIEITKLAEAAEYRRTIAFLQQNQVAA